MDKTIASRDAEQALIAFILQFPSRYRELSDIVKEPSCFSWECFGWCWEAFADLTERGLTIDVVMLGNELDRAGRLDEFQLPEQKLFSGRAALSQLRDIEITQAGESYAMTVEDYAGKRQIDQWLTEAHGWAHNGRTSAAIMSDLQTSFGTLLLHSGKIMGNTNTAEQAGARAMELSKLASKGERVMTTGLIDLDKQLYPQRGELITIAAQTGKGKSSLLGTIALNAARAGKRVKLFTLEMPAPQVAQRFLSQLSGICASRIMQGNMTADEWIKYREAFVEFSELPITICDLSAIRISQIRTEARRSPVDIIMVDYIQLANADKPKENRVLDIGEVTRGLKGLARELDVPLFAAAQLSRAVDARGDKKPILSDLRESGSIEQDSDSVVAIYRKESITPSDNATTELLILKHRNGPTGIVTVHFKEETMQFLNAEIYHINFDKVYSSDN